MAGDFSQAALLRCSMVQRISRATRYAFVLVSILVLPFCAHSQPPADTDNDGLPDDYEIAVGLDPNDPADALADQDGDGLSALEEFGLGTDPFQSDSDGDGTTDDADLCPGLDDSLDADGDGWTACGGDCCDDPAACGAPQFVNPGAMEIFGNGFDDDCDATTPDTGPVACSTSTDFTDLTGTQLAQAMDICQAATPGEGKWGLLDAQLVNADGSTPNANQLNDIQNSQTAVLQQYGNNVVPQSGPTMAGLSTGRMRDQNDPGYVNPNVGTDFGRNSNPPAAYLAANGGSLPSSASCNGNCPAGSGANDSVNLRLTLRVPTNAQGLRYDWRYFSAEYGQFVCTTFNDFHLSLLTSAAPGLPADKNIVFDALGNPVSVNNAFFEVCPPQGCYTCPLGTSDLAGTGMQLGNTGGGTGWLQTTAPVVPGETITLELMVFDVSDNIYDSLVLLDGFEFVPDPLAVNQIVDTQPPLLSLPASVTLEADGPSGTPFNFSATATDDIDPSPSISCAPASGTTFPIGATSVSCTATDAAGNSASGSFLVTVLDTTGPSLSVPADVTLEAEGPGGTPFSFSATATDLVDPAPSVACSADSGTTFPLGVTTVSCTATDATGNSNSASFNVTVVDTTRPTLTVPADVTLEAEGPAGTPFTFSATATDLVDPAPSVNCSPASGATFPLGTTTVSCTATDTAGNSSSAIFDVTVVDTTEPSLSVPANVTLEAEGPAGTLFTFSATATDLVDPAPFVECSPASGSTFPIGATTVSCTATDAAGNSDSGNFVVTVVDTTGPSLSLPADVTLEAEGPAGTPLDFSATANDLVDPAPIVECLPASGSTFPLGASTVSCTATDTAGNSSSASFEVTVVDTTEPLLSVPADVTLEAEGPAGAPFTFSATATDLVDPAPSVDCSPASGTTFPLGTTTVSCTTTDTAGNSASAGLEVTVVDTTPPVIAQPPDLTVEQASPSGTEVDYTLPAASDLVDGTVVVNCVPPPGTTFAAGATTVACSASDTAGNQAQVSFDVTVADTTPPALTAGPAALLEATGLAGAAYSFTASASDAADPNPAVACSAQSGDTFPLGTTTVQCTATDASGNSTVASFEVTVEDTTAPTLTVPGDITVFPTSPAGETVSFSASAVDIVDPAPVVTCAPPSGSVFPIGTTAVSCSATDASNNSSSASFNVTVQDPTPPVVLPTVVGQTGNGGWFIGDVTVTWTVTDPESPITGTGGCDTTVLNVDTTGTAFTCEATSLGGTTTETVSIKRDATPPVIVVTTDPPANAAGWHNTDVTVIFNASDATSGVASATAPTVITAEGITTVNGSATDVAGNSAAAAIVVRIDKTAPEALNRFDPVAFEVAVIGLDGGVELGPVAPSAVVPTFWNDRKGRHDEDEDEDEEDDNRGGRGPKFDAELRTYEVNDIAGNRLVLVEKVRLNVRGRNPGRGRDDDDDDDGNDDDADGRIDVVVVSLQYNDGPVIKIDPEASKRFQWDLNKDDTLSKLDQRMTIGKGRYGQRTEAKYSGKKHETKIKVKSPHSDRDKETLPGLVLLQMRSDQGSLLIEY